MPPFGNPVRTNLDTVFARRQPQRVPVQERGNSYSFPGFGEDPRYTSPAPATKVADTTPAQTRGVYESRAAAATPEPTPEPEPAYRPRTQEEIMSISDRMQAEREGRMGGGAPGQEHMDAAGTTKDLGTFAQQVATGPIGALAGVTVGTMARGALGLNQNPSTLGLSGLVSDMLSDDPASKGYSGKGYGGQSYSGGYGTDYGGYGAGSKASLNDPGVAGMPGGVTGRGADAKGGKAGSVGSKEGAIGGKGGGGSDSSGSCFITTVVCGGMGLPDDCAPLTTLRALRDRMGRIQVFEHLPSEYRRIAPPIATWIEAHPESPALCAMLYGEYIAPAVQFAAQGKDSSAVRVYSAMVRKLQEMMDAADPNP